MTSIARAAVEEVNIRGIMAAMTKEAQINQKFCRQEM
jgi:hypothetical protein